MADYNSIYSGAQLDEAVGLARDGTVRKTGDKMTGNLTVEKSTPIINLNDTAAGSGGRIFGANSRVYIQTANVSGSDANRRQLVLANSAAVDKTKALALHDIVDGSLTAYYIYGGHNKPTAADIQAGTFAGKVVANTAAVATNNIAQVRNTYITPNDLTAGTSAITTGNIYLVYA